MKSTKIPGVFKEGKQFYTINPEYCKGKKVYNEKIKRIKGVEYRSWNPYRSKFSSALINGIEIEIKDNYNILYLGAATGTTVSHFSDILTNGTIYAVENSPVSMKKLLELTKIRKNIVPIFNDAFHPDRYITIVPKVDLIYQDISQRNQAEIFNVNIEKYLKPEQKAIIMVKARSIDVSLPPKKAIQKVITHLEEKHVKIIDNINLAPYEKDHAAIIVST